MTSQDVLQIILFFILLIVSAPILGKYMSKVFSGERHFMLRIFGWLEKLIYRFSGIHPEEETNWKSYTFNLLIFNLAGFLFLFLIQLFQFFLPLNPEHFSNISWQTAFNTAISFTTNTNWQSYAGETTLSYFVQMLGLTVQNFVSAATGISVLLALIRGISRKCTDRLGNFWVDMTRSVIYVLLPLSIMLATVLLSQGVINNFKSYEVVTTVEGKQQIIPMGPVASQLAIKQLGTNGGGFFNANSAHPFENPTPLSNFLQMFAILLIPVSLTFTYGKMVGSAKQGRSIFAVMLLLLVIGLGISLYSEFSSNQIFGQMQLMEGKETRFGISNSVLWSSITTAASNGSVNSMHSSFSPLSGMVMMLNMMLGEVIFGGVGAGIYGMFIFIILTVFIAGLMVGRTPEYMGKKINAFEIQMSIIAILAPSFVILIFSAIALIFNGAILQTTNTGPHGFSEILYAFCSAAGNNGSAFAGLNANSQFYNIALGIGMLIGRFGVIIPVLAIAGKMAEKKITPPSVGTFRTDNWLFVVLLIVVILIVGGLTFFPALSFGPVVEHLIMNNGITF